MFGYIYLEELRIKHLASDEIIILQNKIYNKIIVRGR